MLKLWVHSHQLICSDAIALNNKQQRLSVFLTYAISIAIYLAIVPKDRAAMAEANHESVPPSRIGIDRNRVNNDKIETQIVADNSSLQPKVSSKPEIEREKSNDNAPEFASNRGNNAPVKFNKDIALNDIDWSQYIQIFDVDAVEIINFQNLFAIATFDAPRPIRPVPADRPFVEPTTPPANPAVPSGERKPIPLPKSKNPDYLIAPRSLDLNKVNPVLTQIAVNDIPVNHRTNYQYVGGIEAGDRRSTDVNVNTTAVYDSQIEESVSNRRVYKLDYRSIYTQLRTVRQQREITTKVVVPETIFGMRQQISFTGDCLTGMNGGSATNAGAQPICSYLPGLKTDEATIDPKTLIPRRFLATSQFGEAVTAASLQAMKAPGFQGGADGQLLGLDLYFPKIGTQPGNTQGDKTFLDRFEGTTLTPMAAVGRIHQSILANGSETAISRTIRGFNYVGGDRNTGWMAGLQAASELLPDAEPSLPEGKKGGSTEIERSLILAANNNRIPDNSLTAYYTGIGRGRTPVARQSNSANYFGIWLGFSPVIERSVTAGATIQDIGAERITIAAGGEGGVDGNSSVAALIDRNAFNSTAITSAYVQTYLTTYARDLNTYSSTTLRERTNYQPHISATGNVTTADSVLRYYTGAMINPQSSNNSSNGYKAYLGADFTKVAGQGLTYNLAGIGYLNPDNDYYSKLTGTISQSIGLGRNPAYNLTLSTSINYVIDGTRIIDAVSFQSANSYINFGTRANLNNVSVGATYFMSTTMPNSLGNLLSTSASWKIADGLALSGYFTPINDNRTRAPFGASASIRLGITPTSPTLALGWNRNEIDLITNRDGSRSGIADNVFSAYLRFDR